MGYFIFTRSCKLQVTFLVKRICISMFNYRTLKIEALVIIDLICCDAKSNIYIAIKLVMFPFFKFSH